MQCKKPGCNGEVIENRCQVCGTSAATNESSWKTPSGKALTITASVRALLESKSQEATMEDLVSASRTLEDVVPDDYQAWRTQADLLVNAIHQLEIRQIEPDESVSLIGIPLRETGLRDAAENALRNCAHFAQTFDERVTLIDEANRIRRTTWF